MFFHELTRYTTFRLQERQISFPRRSKARSQTSDMNQICHSPMMSRAKDHNDHHYTLLVSYSPAHILGQYSPAAHAQESLLAE